MKWFSKSKAKLDVAVEFSDWTLHDLRRTYSTIHARLGTPVHITEALLNHQSGTISGVAQIYNRYDYMKEMQTAVLAYEAELANIVGPIG